MLLQKMLQLEGYTNVLGITDPTQAADLYALHRFDIVLLDLNMPLLDGFQVMQQLQAAAPTAVAA